MPSANALLRSALLLFLTTSTLAVNVLIFLPGTHKWDRVPLEFLAQALALRHHGVATFKAVIIPEQPMLVKHKLHMVKEMTMKNVVPRELYAPFETIGDEIPWRADYDLVDHQMPYWNAYNYSCVKLLNSDLMDKLKKESFDLAIVYAGNPCHLALVHAMALPFVYFDVNGFTDETAVAAGVVPSALIPSSRTAYKMPLTLTERLMNTLSYAREYVTQGGYPGPAGLISSRYHYMDGPISKLFREDYELKKRFPHFPDVNRIKRDAELYFINSDPLIEHPRSSPPNVIFVGGLHIDHVKPLFYPWNFTMPSAADGVIVCSLGATNNVSAMPTRMSTAMLNAFKQLKRNRIFWRTGPAINITGIDRAEIPLHINITSFIPQNDLLGAKETRVFITNGGMNGIMEAIAHGVPMLGIPLMGENYANLRKVEAAGLGILLDKNNVTERNLLTAIRELLDNPKYRLASKEVSKAYKDRPLSPFDSALYWIEYVGRHHGAKHIKPPLTLKGSLIQLLGLDVVIVFGLMLVSWTLITAKLITCACSWLFTPTHMKELRVKQVFVKMAPRSGHKGADASNKIERSTKDDSEVGSKREEDQQSTRRRTNKEAPNERVKQSTKG